VLEIADDLYPTPVTADKKLPVLFRKEKVRNSVVVIVSEFENYWTIIVDCEELTVIK
jgi:hypothetical protein